MPKEKREPRKHQLDAGSKNGQLEKVKDWLIKNQKPKTNKNYHTCDTVSSSFNLSRSYG